MEILDDEVMVSFDVVSLFTAIPVTKACEYIRNKLSDSNSLNNSQIAFLDKLVTKKEWRYHY